MKPIHFLPLLLLLFSCKNEREAQLQRDIVGEWEFAKFEYTPQEDSLPFFPIMENKFGFEFKPEGVYEDKLGFGWEDTIKGNGYGAWHDAGRISKYIIKGDSLRLFNPVYKKWKGIKIVSVTKDTLVLQDSNDAQQKYSRLKVVKISDEHFDEIIVSSSFCYGSCPVLDISIQKNGAVRFSGQDYTLHDGNFTSKISGKEFAEIEQSFLKADIKTLEENYAATHTDDRTVTVTFIKNGCIYKTISDYGNEAPAAFNWAYTPVLYLYQHIDLKPATLPYPELRKGALGYYRNGWGTSLEQSEQFYLITELEKAKKTEQVFVPKFWLQYGFFKRGRAMQTDGRYFKFPPEDGGITLDLGYNFITRNGLEKRFAKNE